MPTYPTPPTPYNEHNRARRTAIQDLNTNPARFAGWPPDIQAQFLGLARRQAEVAGINPPPTAWPHRDPMRMLQDIAPNYATSPLGPHHLDFWRWVYNIEPGVRPRPFIGVWSRGAAKTSSVQLAVAMLAGLGRRHYCLFVARTQDQGDKKVEDLSAIFTSTHYADRYPKMARKKTFIVSSGTGNARHTAEWSRTRVRTEAGFTVEAIGLDVAARGIKVEDQRPDVIVIDDADDQSDNPGKVRQHLNALRRSIFPAGSADRAIIVINNLVHDNSIASHLAFPERFPEAERLLLNRILSGPIPAVDDLETVYTENAGDGEPGYVITAGTPSWAGFTLAHAQAAINDSNLADFLSEYQHSTEEVGEFFSHIDWRLCDLDEVPWGQLIVVQCWVDPATSDNDRSDSMGISVAGVTANGTVYVLYSWEQVTSPTEALKQAYRKSYEYGASLLGIETDNGGDAWFPVAREALRELVEDGEIPAGYTLKLDGQRAGQVGKSKVERVKQLITPLERQRIILVRGTHNTLIRGLKRFPKKPLDGVDAFWWAWSRLTVFSDRKPSTVRTAAKTPVERWRPSPRR